MTTLKIESDRTKLLDAFAVASTVAPKRHNKPIIQSVLVKADGNLTTVAATDLEVSVLIRVEGVNVSHPGSCLVPPQKFGAFLTELREETVSVEDLDDGIRVASAGSEIKFGKLPVEDFPAMEVTRPKDYHVVAGSILKELLRRTMFATDDASSRYALGGVLLDFGPDKITAVATDGRRLATVSGGATMVGNHSPKVQVIVPTRALTMISRAIREDEEVKIGANENSITLASDRWVIEARLIEGRFPDWKKVFPERVDNKVSFAAGVLHSAVRQAAIAATHESAGLDFRFDKGLLSMSGLTAEIGSSRVEIPIAYDGEAVDVRLDHRFVEDFLKVLDKEKVAEVDVEDGDSAVVFSVEDGFKYVVMPLADG